MSPSVLLTLISLLVAIFAIIPPERKLDLRVRFNWFDWSLFAFTFLLIHYILFFPILYNLGVPSLGDWKWGFDPENSSYLIILITAVILSVRYINAPLRKSKIKLFKKLTERLFQEEKYSDLLFLLENNLERLFKIYKTDFFFPRLKRKLTINPIHRLDFSQFGLNNIEEGDKDLSKIEKLKKWNFKKIQNHLKYIPGYVSESETAETIISRLLLSNDFTAHLTKADPILCLKILEFDFRERKNFLKLFVYNLLDDTSSIIYFELKNNQETRSIYRFKIDSRNQFLSFFLKDVKRADELAIYKPFGDHFLEYLDKLYVNPRQDRYNEPLLNYYESEMWECPLHITIRFFELMVLEALYQKINWHMWLFYLPSFVKKILRNLNPDSNVNLSDEFPTPYHFLLYEIIAVLKRFVRAIEEIPEDRENIVIENERLDHSNGNIPKSAILATGRILRSVLLSSKLDNRFKSYLLEPIMRLVNDLRTQGLESYKRLLQNSVLNGGSNFNRDDQQYTAELNAAIQNIDIILRNELDDYE